MRWWRRPAVGESSSADRSAMPTFEVTWRTPEGETRGASAEAGGVAFEASIGAHVRGLPRVSTSPGLVPGGAGGEPTDRGYPAGGSCARIVGSVMCSSSFSNSTLLRITLVIRSSSANGRNSRRCVVPPNDAGTTHR
jgi:hypothetical protein